MEARTNQESWTQKLAGTNNLPCPFQIFHSAIAPRSKQKMNDKEKPFEMPQGLSFVQTAQGPKVELAEGAPEMCAFLAEFFRGDGGDAFFPRMILEAAEKGSRDALTGNAYAVTVTDTEVEIEHMYLSGNPTKKYDKSLLLPLLRRWLDMWDPALLG